MRLTIPRPIFERIVQHLERAYPEEGAGLLLGRMDEEHWVVQAVFPAANTWQGAERRRRYLIDPQTVAQAEEEAEARGHWVLGVYHSHPDHPSRPSEFDRAWALPGWVYLIVEVRRGRVQGAQAWRLREDRSAFDEVPLEVVQVQPLTGR